MVLFVPDSLLTLRREAFGENEELFREIQRVLEELNETLRYYNGAVNEELPAAGTLDHNNLNNMAAPNDDHEQYLLESGARAMSGNLNMGANSITPVNTVDGRDVSVDGTKLDGIEVGATVDQTKADIDALGIDHGSTSGKGDDDHAQYHNNARALTWLSDGGAEGGQPVSLWEQIKAGFNLTGGGTISMSGASLFKWTARFIAISNGRGAHFSTTGFFDIIKPDGGILVGVGGASDRTWVVAGIVLNAWEALYYILPVGSAQTSLLANFRVADYQSALEVPANWILLAVRNADGIVKVGTGIHLGLGESRTNNSINAKVDGIETGANNYSHPNHTGEVTSSGDGGQTIAAAAVTNAKLANMAQAMVKGRADGAGTGAPNDLNATQIRAMINVENGAEGNNIADIDATDLTDGGETALHSHAAGPASVDALITGKAPNAIISYSDSGAASRTLVVATTVDQQSNSGQKVLYVAATANLLVVGQPVRIGLATIREETGVIDSVDPGVSITLVDNLSQTHSAGDADSVSVDYAHLLLDVSRIVPGTNDRQVWLRFNSDTGNNYAFAGAMANSSGGHINRWGNVSRIEFGSTVGTGAYGNGTGQVAAIGAEIKDFRDFTKYTVVKMESDAYSQLALAHSLKGTGIWKSNNAITSITLLFESGVGAWRITLSGIPTA